MALQIDDRMTMTLTLQIFGFLYIYLMFQFQFSYFYSIVKAIHVCDFNDVFFLFYLFLKIDKLGMRDVDVMCTKERRWKTELLKTINLNKTLVKIIFKKAFKTSFWTFCYSLQEQCGGLWWPETIKCGLAGSIYMYKNITSKHYVNVHRDFRTDMFTYLHVMACYTGHW